MFAGCNLFLAHEKKCFLYTYTYMYTHAKNYENLTYFIKPNVE